MRHPATRLAVFVVVASVFPMSAAGDEIDELISRLDSDTDASAKLVGHGEAAVKRLDRLMQDKQASGMTRFSAAFALGNIGGEESVKSLCNALDDPKMQEAAMIALTDIGPSAAPAVPKLAKILASAPRNVKSDFTARNAVEAIAAIGVGSPEAVQAIELHMRAGRFEEGAQALPKLGDAGAEAIVRLARKYEDDERSEDSRRFGEVYALLHGKLPPEMLPVFERHLLAGSKDAGVAALALAAIGPPAKDTLIKAMSDKSRIVRVNAVIGLEKMNFAAESARRWRGEDVPNPVSADEVFPKLIEICKLEDGTVDTRIAMSMMRFDEKRASAIPEIKQAHDRWMLSFMLGSAGIRQASKDVPPAAPSAIKKPPQAKSRPLVTSNAHPPQQYQSQGRGLLRRRR